MSPLSDATPVGPQTEQIPVRPDSHADRNVLLEYWLDSSIVLREDWEVLPAEARAAVEASVDLPGLLEKAVAHHLLTDYQVGRIRTGKTFGLILGNFRVLQRLGAGGMGVVFKAEHITMRRLVAVKVVSFLADEDPQMLTRFRAEIRAVAQLQHPNIVSAFDAGFVVNPDPDGPNLHYFVMEYVQGRDLEEWVASDGPLAVPQACHLAYQVATALAEAHKHGLVHRDIKPANILVTPDVQAKLLDFGLARHYRRRITQPGTVLGTIDFMAPEQLNDSSSVDIRADIYGLGSTLFWCLTGQHPFEPQTNLNAERLARLSQPAPQVRRIRPELPVEVDQILGKMMAIDPSDRYPTPQSLMRALLPLLGSDSPVAIPEGFGAGAPSSGETRSRPQVLIVDDEPDICTLAAMILHPEGIGCDAVGTGKQALETLSRGKYDLVLLDVDMPGLSGLEVLSRLRENPPTPYLKIVMMSGRVSADEMAQTLRAGADDYLNKPFSLAQLRSRVQAALKLKEVQDRAHQLNWQLISLAAEQERALKGRESDLISACNALVLALAKLVTHRETEPTSHLQRLQKHCRCLAEEAARLPAFGDEINENFVQMLEACAPLHDIGKVVLPEYILLKPGKLTTEERLIMQTHTTIGADTLAEVGEQYRCAQGFWQMAITVVRHHHERWDGTGYPDRLSGEGIPLAARLVALADTYDALRSRRTYRPGLSHAAAAQLIQESGGHFDPRLLDVFRRCAGRLEQIYRDSPK